MEWMVGKLDIGLHTVKDVDIGENSDKCFQWEITILLPSWAHLSMLVVIMTHKDHGYARLLITGLYPQHPAKYILVVWKLANRKGAS